ncbi:hypothetical protein BDD12DRAFT_891731 [Trichophaea hybrida]|nr:hypothetical protein BDD12DRAFT_891731 [Trichophaea hybrida]
MGVGEDEERNGRRGQDSSKGLNMSDMDGYDYQFHAMQTIKADVESTFKKLQNNILSQLAVQGSDSRKYYNEFFAQVATLEAKKKIGCSIQLLRSYWLRRICGRGEEASGSHSGCHTARRSSERNYDSAGPTKTPTWVVTPLAQQVLMRNMAKWMEQSESQAIDVDKNLAPFTGRPSTAPRQLSPTL